MPLAWREIVPGGPGAFVPVDPDALLDVMDDASFRENDEKMPYFALLWPAGESLAALVWRGSVARGRCACSTSAAASGPRGSARRRAARA